MAVADAVTLGDEGAPTVALKLIKRGIDSDRIHRRFLAERKILASLDHPYIARLLDAGLTDAGQPWFAMEHVEGTTIVAHCEARGLGLDDRLRLFLDVGEAVAYAHRNGVIHRDLKPGNILVTRDGRAPPERDSPRASAAAVRSAVGGPGVEPTYRYAATGPVTMVGPRGLDVAGHLDR